MTVSSIRPAARVAGVVLCILLGLLFIFSALAKLGVLVFISHWPGLEGFRRGDGLQTFEWSFIDLLHVNNLAAAIIARIFIGVELLLGLFLIAQLWLRSFTYKATMALMVVMTIYLIGLLVVNGNTGSCGCFGEGIEMKPLPAIIKNLVIIGVIYMLMRIYPQRTYNGSFYIGTILVIASLGYPFWQRQLLHYKTGDVANEPIYLNPLYNGQAKPVFDHDVRKGKHVLACFSLTCPHCFNSAYKLYALKRQYPALPVSIVLGGKEENLKTFITETNIAALSWSHVPDMDTFIAIAGPSVPQIYLVEEGRIVRKMHGNIRNPQIVLDWLKKQ